MGILRSIKNYLLRRFGRTLVGLYQPLYLNTLTAEELERVIKLLKVHLADPLFRNRKKHHAYTHFGLAVCYYRKAIYFSDFDKDAVNAAIRSACEAEVFLTREHSPRGWEMIQQILGTAYFVKTDGPRAEHYEVAVSYLENALESLDARDNPEYQFELRIQLVGACAFRLSGTESEKIAKADEHAAKALELLPPELREESGYAKAVHELKAMAHFGATMKLGIGAIDKDFTDRLAEIFRRLRGDDEAKDKSLFRVTDIMRGMARLVENLDSLLERANVPPEEVERLREKYKNNALADLVEILPPEDIQVLSDLIEELIEENLAFIAGPESAADRTESDFALAQLYCQQSSLKREEADKEHSLSQARFHFERGWEGLMSSGRPFYVFMMGRFFGTLLYFRYGLWHEAEKYYRAALDVLDRSYEASMGAHGKHFALSDVNRESISIPLLLNQAYTLARTGRPEDAVVLLEKWRGRRLNERLERTYTQLTRIKPEDLAAYQQAWRDILDLEAAQRGAIGDEYSRLVRRLQDARASLEEVVRRVRRYLPNFLAEPTFAEVRQAATVEKPLAYLLTTDMGSLTLTVSAGGELNCLWCDDFASGDVEAILKKLSPTLGLEEGVLGGNTGAALHEVLLELEQRLLATLIHELREAGTAGVCLIPCGSLALLPLHAILLTADVGLRKSFEVSHAPSARALLSARKRLKQFEERENAASHLLGVADTACNLSYATGEAEAIKRLFKPPASARLLLHEAATKDALKAALPEATHIHFACHGEYNPVEPLENALVLANGDHLTLRDVFDGGEFHFSPDARMVVLSACRTALIDFRDLPEEVVGLSTGFLSAGLPEVVGTLWPVDDRSTALLMLRFYTHLITDRMRAAAALCEAQRWLRDATREAVGEFCAERPELIPPLGACDSVDSRDARLRQYSLPPGHKPFSDPYYWAGFVYVGA